MGRDERDFLDDLAGGALEVVVPALGGAVGARWSQLLRREWRRNLSVALAAAETEAGMSREDLAEVLEQDPRSVPLYLQVLWAAGMNGHETTLRGMGAVLGRAASAARDGDDRGLNRADLALRAMSNLTPQHFEVLGNLPHFSLTSPEVVAKATRIDEDLAEQCLLNLAAAGLTRRTQMAGRITYLITDLGVAVMQAAGAVNGD